jgi:hypothetical protein
MIECVISVVDECFSLHQRACVAWIGIRTQPWLSQKRWSNLTLSIPVNSYFSDEMLALASFTSMNSDTLSGLVGSVIPGSKRFTARVSPHLGVSRVTPQTSSYRISRFSLNLSRRSAWLDVSASTSTINDDAANASTSCRGLFLLKLVKNFTS